MAHLQPLVLPLQRTATIWSGDLDLNQNGSDHICNYSPITNTAWMAAALSLSYLRKTRGLIQDRTLRINLLWPLKRLEGFEPTVAGPTPES